LESDRECAKDLLYFNYYHDMSIKICTNEHQVLGVTILTYKCMHCVT